MTICTTLISAVYFLSLTYVFQTAMIEFWIRPLEQLFSDQTKSGCTTFWDWNWNEASSPWCNYTEHYTSANIYIYIAGHINLKNMWETGLVSVKQMCHLEEYLVCFSKFSSHHYFHILLFFWGFVVVISESSIYSTDIASQDFIHQLFLPFFFPFVLFFFCLFSLLPSSISFQLRYEQKS